MLDNINISKIIDVSAVRADCSQTDVHAAFDIAVQHGCIAVFSLPCFTPLLRALLDSLPSGKARPLLGGALGFPSGGETTNMKAMQAKELLAFGCNEIDMVMNIGFMRSGMYDAVENDIKTIKQVLGDTPLKVILECHYLEADKICRASEIAVRAGASWVKTGTGWAPSGATFENVALIKKTIGNAAKVKAAGGVRDLNTMEKMIRLGVERFGIATKTAVAILEELSHRKPQGTVTVASEVQTTHSY